MTRPGRLRALLGEERGSASVLALTLSVALILAIGMAVDGSRKAQAVSESTAVAEEAARAGGQALQAHALAAGRAAEVEPAQAAAEAWKYLAAAGVTGRVSIEDRRVVVDVTITRSTIFLSLIGISEVSATGRGAANLVSAG